MAISFWSIAGLLAAAVPAPSPEAGPTQTIVSAQQLLTFGSQAELAGDSEAAIAAYKALEHDPNVDVRNEARFRHGKLCASQKRLTDAAILFRAILDEKPDAQRVRLELAATLARMGDGTGARRALRQAQAGGLPADVARMVDQYAAALRAFKPFGASFELAMAPSNNINRATRSTTLDTVLAPFELSDDARAQSGIGIKAGGQAYARIPVAPAMQILTRLAAQGSFYRDDSFNDLTGTGQIGLEALVGKSRFRPLVGRSYRRYGGRPYATTDSLTVNWTRSAGKRAQLEVEAAAGQADYRLNDLQDGAIYNASLGYERAISQRAGGSISILAQRQSARDPGYATTSAGIDLLAWCETGKTSLFVSAGLSRLEADKRLLLFPKRRTEWLARAGAGATFRQIKVAGFSPLVRLSYERNHSTVELYDYSRFGAELGIARAF